MMFRFSPLCRVLGGALLVLVLAACDRPGSSGGAAPGGPPPAPPVSVAAAIRRPVIETDQFPGRIAAVERVEVRARVRGYLDGIHFTPGTEVAKGALLFSIDPRPFEARLAEVEAELANTLADLALAETELARQARMRTTRATSEREYDAAKATVARLVARRQANEAAIASARLELSYTRITAPVAGRVGREEVTAGNLIAGDGPDSPVLTTLVSMDPVWVEFEADEAAYLRYIGAARDADLSVAVGLAGEADFPHAAELAYVDNRIDPATGTLRLRARLANPERRFTPGLFARVRLAASATAREAVMVADRAIATDQSRRYVLVVGADGIANYREVTIGRLVDGLRVIEHGLEAGERVVVNGLQRVRPGSAVAPETVEMEAAASGKLTQGGQAG